MIPLVLAVAPSPTGTPEFDPNTVTPGVIGFLITFAVAAAVVVLVLDMTKRIRRVRYRGEIAERLDAEELERDAEEREEADRIIRRLDPDSADNADRTDRTDDGGRRP